MRQSPLPLFAAVFILIVFGLTTIWSTTSHLFFPQLIFIAIGLILALAIYKTDLTLLYSISWPLYLFSIFSLVFTLVLGEVTRGSTRWIDLGPFRFQISEMIKPMLAIFYANYLAENPVKNFRSIITYLFLLVLPTLLIIVQPDLGSAMVIFATGSILLIVAGLPFRYLFLGLFIFISASIPVYRHLKPYQQQRIHSFINPYADPGGSGYNVIQSVIAIGSGKIYGLGVKQGTQSHLKFLPERHTDFVYASFAEEFGLIGSTLIFGSYLSLFYFLSRLITKLNDNREIYLAAAILVVFAFQAIVNLGMNLGIMPVTGITLPLVSYGGSSMISLFSLIGLSLNLNRRSAFSHYH